MSVTQPSTPPGAAPDLPDSLFTWQFRATGGDLWGGTLVANSGAFRPGAVLPASAGAYTILAEDARGLDLSAIGLEDGAVHVAWYWDASAAGFLPTRTGVGAAAGLAGLGTEEDWGWTGTAWDRFGLGGLEVVDLAGTTGLLADARYGFVFEASGGDRWGGLLFERATSYAPGDVIRTAAGRYRITEETPVADGTIASGAVRLTGSYYDSATGTFLAVQDADGLVQHGSSGLGSEYGLAFTGGGLAPFGLAGNLQIGEAVDGTRHFPFALSTPGFGIDSAGSRIRLADGTVLTGFGLQLVFTDGRIANRDGDGLFDGIFYGGVYRDVFAAQVGARGHYAQFGWTEGRDPNAFFSTRGYLSLNGDVRDAGLNPLEHYRAFGAREGRDPSWNFDTRLYLTRHPDVAAAGLDALTHYLMFGAAEGRATGPALGRTLEAGFDAEFYLLRHADVGFARVDAAAHFRIHGWREGRDPNGWFDTRGYLAVHDDVRAAGIDPLAHYMQWGWREGRDPSTRFDSSAYRAANADVAAAGINPLEHFLRYGIFEGRSPQDDAAWG